MGQSLLIIIFLDAIMLVDFTDHQKKQKKNQPQHIRHSDRNRRRLAHQVLHFGPW